MNEHARDFDKKLKQLGDGGRHKWQAFRDFVELSALCMANRFPFRTDQRDEQHSVIAKGYKPEEITVHAEMLAITMLALYDEPQDFLGPAFMRNELASHWHGQYFTPWEVARVMAMLTLDLPTAQERIKERGFVSAHEPAAGSGVMVLALAESMKANGLDPTRQLYVEAWDLERTAALMCYVQLSVLNIPATVVIGNSLTGPKPSDEHWKTHQLISLRWEQRAREEAEGPRSLDTSMLLSPGQLELF